MANKKLFITIIVLAVIGLAGMVCSLVARRADNYNARVERLRVHEGNALYLLGKYPEAIAKYKEAMESDATSEVARFNLGLTRVVYGAQKLAVQQDDSIGQQLMKQGNADLVEVMRLGDKNPHLASVAAYDLGNFIFQSEQYSQAIEQYKYSLRLEPDFDDARRNLRIAQLKRQENPDQNQNQDNQDQNQDQNKDNQDQNKDQNQDQDKKDQQDQNQDKQDKDQDKQDQQQNQQQQDQRQQENEMSQQAAQQILNAVENNENQTRARKAHAEGQKGSGTGASNRPW